MQEHRAGTCEHVTFHWHCVPLEVQSDDADEISYAIALERCST